MLVLAGDIIADVAFWDGSNAVDIYTPWLTDLAQRHKAVIYVGGNHEGYMSSFKTAFRYMNKLAGRLGNMFVLENDSVVVDGVKFLGTTMWTPLDGPLDQFLVRDMNDFEYIGSWTVFKWRAAYTVARSFLETELSKEHDGPVVVVTHHLPSYQSIGKQFIERSDQCAYAANQDDLMLKYKPALWCHGHTHDSFDYGVMDYGDVLCTRVVCNPHGYYGKEVNSEYDPTKVVEV